MERGCDALGGRFEQRAGWTGFRGFCMEDRDGGENKDVRRAFLVMHCGWEYKGVQYLCQSSLCLTMEGLLALVRVVGCFGGMVCQVGVLGLSCSGMLRDFISLLRYMKGL